MSYRSRRDQDRHSSHDGRQTRHTTGLKPSGSSNKGRDGIYGRERTGVTGRDQLSHRKHSTGSRSSEDRKHLRERYSHTKSRERTTASGKDSDSLKPRSTESRSQGRDTKQKMGEQDLREKIRGRKGKQSTTDGDRQSEEDKIDLRDFLDNRTSTTKEEDDIMLTLEKEKILEDNDKDLQKYHKLEKDFIKYFDERESIERNFSSRDNVGKKVDREDLEKLDYILDDIKRELEARRLYLRDKIVSGIKRLESERHRRGTRAEKAPRNHSGKDIDTKSRTREKRGSNSSLPPPKSSWSAPIAEKARDETASSRGDTERVVDQTQPRTDSGTDRRTVVAHPSQSKEEEEDTLYSDIEELDDLHQEVEKDRLLKKIESELQMVDPAVREEVLSSFISKENLVGPIKGQTEREGLTINNFNDVDDNPHKSSSNLAYRKLDTGDQAKNYGSTSSAVQSVKEERVGEKYDKAQHKERQSKICLDEERNMLGDRKPQDSSLRIKSETDTRRNDRRDLMSKETSEDRIVVDNALQHLRSTSRERDRKRSSRGSDVHDKVRRDSYGNKREKGSSRSHEQGRKREASSRRHSDSSEKKRDALRKLGKQINALSQGHGKPGGHDSMLYYEKFLSLIGDATPLSTFGRPQTIPQVSTGVSAVSSSTAEFLQSSSLLPSQLPAPNKTQVPFLPANRAPALMAVRALHPHSLGHPRPVPMQPARMIPPAHGMNVIHTRLPVFPGQPVRFQHVERPLMPNVYIPPQNFRQPFSSPGVPIMPSSNIGMRPYHGQVFPVHSGIRLESNIRMAHELQTNLAARVPNQTDFGIIQGDLKDIPNVSTNSSFNTVGGKRDNNDRIGDEPARIAELVEEPPSKRHRLSGKETSDLGAGLIKREAEQLSVHKDKVSPAVPMERHSEKGRGKRGRDERTSAVPVADQSSTVPIYSSSPFLNVTRHVRQENVHSTFVDGLKRDSRHFQTRTALPDHDRANTRESQAAASVSQRNIDQSTKGILKKSILKAPTKEFKERLEEPLTSQPTFKGGRQLSHLSTSIAQSEMHRSPLKAKIREMIPSPLPATREGEDRDILHSSISSSGRQMQMKKYIDEHVLEDLRRHLPQYTLGVDESGVYVVESSSPPREALSQDLKQREKSEGRSGERMHEDVRRVVRSKDFPPRGEVKSRYTDDTFPTISGYGNEQGVSTTIEGSAEHQISALLKRLAGRPLELGTLLEGRMPRRTDEESRFALANLPDEENNVTTSTGNSPVVSEDIGYDQDDYQQEYLEMEKDNSNLEADTYHGYDSPLQTGSTLGHVYEHDQSYGGSVASDESTPYTQEKVTYSSARHAPSRRNKKLDSADYYDELSGESETEAQLMDLEVPGGQKRDSTKRGKTQLSNYYDELSSESETEAQLVNLKDSGRKKKSRTKGQASDREGERRDFSPDIVERLSRVHGTQHGSHDKERYHESLNMEDESLFSASRETIDGSSGDRHATYVSEPMLCNVCNLAFSTSFSMQFHLSTEKHALAVERNATMTKQLQRGTITKEEIETRNPPVYDYRLERQKDIPRDSSAVLDRAYHNVPTVKLEADETQNLHTSVSQFAGKAHFSSGAIQSSTLCPSSNQERHGYVRRSGSEQVHDDGNEIRVVKENNDAPSLSRYPMQQHRLDLITPGMGDDRGRHILQDRPVHRDLPRNLLEDRSAMLSRQPSTTSYQRVLPFDSSAQLERQRYLRELASISARSQQL